MPFVSYAQNFEDVLLNRVFGGQGTGFYVDVGAYHPVIGSTTKVFYDRGWSGINVEPGSVFAELAAARPRDVNLHMAVMDYAGEVAFIEVEADSGTSHVAVDADSSGSARMVPCDTLEAIVRAHSDGRPVDFVKVDAEGTEEAIVRSTDWHRLRPRVLLLEATLPWSNTLANQLWEPALLEQGYVRAYFDGINCFYIPEEEVPVLLRHFQVPVNALDRAVSHDYRAPRTTLNDQQNEVDLGADELDLLQAALRDRRDELARLTSERDALQVSLRDRQDELASLTSERDALLVVSSEQRDEVVRLISERDALRDGLNRCTDTIQGLEARLAPPSGPAPAVAWPPKMGDDLVRRAALFAYKLVRPVARPAAWRLRGFMIGGLSEQMRHLEERIEILSVRPKLPFADDRAPIERAPTESTTTEMRQLAVAMEQTLLTLAMERAPDTWPAAGQVQPDPIPAPQRVVLRLPHGRAADVECVAGDLSVAGSLKASGGDWEPHVRRYLETIVRPDWVCLDVGANLGAHTLSLAVLAHDGRVVAFEADATNFALLSRNAGALAPPRAVIDPVHLALWDSHGTVVVGGADELAGCSFVAEDVTDSASIERRLRTVVNGDAINRTELHMRLSGVPALPLDAWIDSNPLARLDLIKLDVEGAETRVIRGADATLRRHRPVLIVEYNPACAGVYFGQSPDALFRELEGRFAAINAIEPDGTLTPLADWAGLEKRIAQGKGWEDLVCLPDVSAQS